jgi:hypothetical protein
MTRFFNTAGPCRPERHYMLPPERRLPEVRGLVAQESYFVLHAPRQVGKTTALRSLAESLTREGRHAAALVSMETGAPFSDDIGAAAGVTKLGAARGAAAVTATASRAAPISTVMRVVPFAAQLSSLIACVQKIESPSLVHSAQSVIIKVSSACGGK